MVIDEGKEVNKELALKIQLSVCVFLCLMSPYWVAWTKFFMVAVLNDLVKKLLAVLLF